MSQHPALLTKPFNRDIPRTNIHPAEILLWLHASRRHLDSIIKQVEAHSAKSEAQIAKVKTRLVELESQSYSTDLEAVRKEIQGLKKQVQDVKGSEKKVLVKVTTVGDELKR